MPPPQNVAYPRDDNRLTLPGFHALLRVYDKSNQQVYFYLGLVVGQFLPMLAPADLRGIAAFAWLGGYVVFAVMTVGVCRLAAETTGTNTTVAMVTAGIAMFIPCGALLVLIFLQQRILGKLKAYGIKPGISGVTKKKRAEVEARLSAEAGPVDMSKPPTLG